jgi:predicted DNA binding CopG/RHH family protein
MSGPVKEPVLVRLPPDMIEAIDKRAKKAGISRAAWIRLAVDEKLATR